MTTMKTVSRRTCGTLLGLCVLSMIVPGAGADDASDWAHQHAQAQKEREEWQRQQEQAQRDYEQRERDRQAAQDWQTQREQAQKERDDWYAQQAQAQRDREQAERDQQARDEWYRQQAQAQQERDDWYKQQAQAQRDREQAERDQKERDEWYKQQEQAQKDSQQSILDGIERVKQQRDEILNKAYDDHPWARAGWTAGAEWTPAGWKLPQSASAGSTQAGSVSAATKSPVMQRASIPQFRREADIVPQPLLILNPYVSQPKADQNRTGMSQPIKPAPQEIVPARPEVKQVIVNPFVGTAK